MDELEISGKRYISTRRAAKDNKYHSDYIGQLIRAGKVEGQKVGRSWYVAVDSLADYLGKEGGVRPQPARMRAPAEVIVEEPDVEPAVQKIAVAIKERPREIEREEKVEVEDDAKDADTSVDDDVEHHIPVKISTLSRVKKEIPAVQPKGSLRYIADEGPLYPRVDRPPITSKIIIRPAEVIEDTPYIEEKPVTLIERPRAVKKGGNFFMPRAAIVVISVLALAALAAASAFLVSTTTVKDATASVSYSLGAL